MEHEQGKRPDLEAISVEDAAGLLDQVASEVDSWRLLWLRVHERLGLGLMAERGISVECPANVALDAVEYMLGFENSRVVLRPRIEAVDHTWPVAVDRASARAKELWRALGEATRDHAMRARFSHLLFQAKAGSGRELASGAAEAYLDAVSDDWGAIDRMEFAHAGLRLSLAVGERDQADRAAEVIRDEALRCTTVDAPGIAARGVVILAGVGRLPFDFAAVAEQVLGKGIGSNNADHIYAAWIGREQPQDREPLWRRRVQAAVDDAERTDGLVRVSKLYDALHLAERSGIGGLRRDVASRLQRAGQSEFQMMHMRTVTREYEEAVTEAAEAMIDGQTLAASLIRWASYGPPTGDAARNREAMRQCLEGAVFWHLMPTVLTGPDNLPIYRGRTEAERFDVEVVKYEALVLAHHEPIMTSALRMVVDRYGIPDQASLMGFFETWPGLDRTSARMAANALVRFWAGDFDGTLYTLMPQIERTARNLLLAADEGIYRQQREATPGQYMGLGAMLEPLGRLYGMSEDWQRYFAVCLNHPAGLNLRNLVSHGFTGATPPDLATVVTHLLLHLGTLELPSASEADSAPASGTEPTELSSDSTDATPLSRSCDSEMRAGQSRQPNLLARVG